MRILFVGDVFGAPGRRAVESRLAGAARGARGRLLHRQRRERRRRPRDHGEDRRAAARRGRRRDHARQLGLGPAGLRAVPHGDRPRAAAGEPLAGTPGPRPRRARRRRRDQPARPDDAEPVREPVPRRRPARRGGARARRRSIVVDFHAEATSEKVALAYYLDGRVTAVLGTHTHVQTNDARVLAGGTAAITDAGMTGPHDSVIGSVPDGADPPLHHRLPDAARGRRRATCGSRARSSSAAPTGARRAASRPRRRSSSTTAATAGTSDPGERLVLCDRDGLLGRAGREQRERDEREEPRRGRATTSGSAPARSR